MSIFDGTSGFESSTWLREKTLRALKDGVRIVDLANEADTSPWYQKHLRAVAEPLVGHLLPVVAFLHGAEQEAVTHESWRPILAGGTFALAGWAKKFKVVDPIEAEFQAFAPLRSEEESEEKAEPLPQGLLASEQPAAEDLRYDICTFIVQHMADGKFSPPEMRLLSWLLRNLKYSSYADVTTVAKRFLPTDIGCSIEETATAYRTLYERGYLERVDGVPGVGAESLALRVVAGDRNASRHPVSFREEVFGFAGARVAGQPTIGNQLTIHLGETLTKIVTRWQLTDEERADLRAALQTGIGEDRAYLEQVELDTGVARPTVVVSLRYPMDTSDARMTAEAERIIGEWIRKRVRPG